MDYYQANFQLSRAFHFGFHKIDDLKQKFSDFKKLVDAIILLMKQRVGPAMEILKEIASNDDQYFNDLIFSYRAYGYVNQKQYDKAISDLQKISKLDQASKFNLSLALMLKMKPNPSEKVDRKLKLIQEI